MNTRALIEFDDDNKLWITQEAWDVLRSKKETSAFANIRDTAVGFVAGGGAFLIYRDDKGVMRRFDRVEELKSYIEEIDAERKLAGLVQIGA